MKKVSVIIPVYNSQQYIEKCVNSVVNQTYKKLEIIIIDDNSNDDSLKIIKSIKDKRIKIIELKKNKGVACARNEGVKIATGDYICYIDSDDYWKKDKIEKQVEFIKDKVFIYSGFSYFKKNKFKDVQVPLSLTYNDALKNTIILTSTVMFNMKYLDKEDIYMPIIKRGQDTATWWQVLKKGITAYGLNEVLTIYRVNKNSLSSNIFRKVLRTWKIYKREDLNPLKRLYCYNCYIINALKKRL